MECSLCQSPLAEGATVCGACGQDVRADAADATSVSASRGPDTTGGPPRGEVLAERWEIEERTSSDVLMSRYRAHDQETEARVVLTLIAPDVAPSLRERASVRERLATAVGIGNKYLPGLIDADREAQFVFAVEPFVAGASLRSVLDARRARGETMHVAEVLPVVAQLAAALAGIAPPHHHGDVRAERVLIGTEGLRLVGAFVLPALPPASVARMLANEDAWRTIRAPEAWSGPGSDAADRFGVAAIAFEALTGAPPGPGAPPLLGTLAPVEEALRALLAPEPGARPRSLDALVEALAECAHLPVPDLDPGAFRRVRRASASRPPPAGTPPSVVVEPSFAPPDVPALDTPHESAFDQGPFDTSPVGSIDADSTSRMPALNADGEVVSAPPAPISGYPEIPDLATDPSATMPTGRESSRSARILVPDLPPASEPSVSARGLVRDPLPPAYRLEEGPTLAENSMQTRRVVPLSPAPAPAPAALARPPSTPPRPASTPPRPASTPPRQASTLTRPASTPPQSKSTPPPRATAPVAPAPASPQRTPAQAPRVIAGAAAGGTQEIAMEDVFEAAPAKKSRADESLDPRLVRAALGIALDDEAELEPDEPVTGKKRGDDSLDPRLVRAALGIALESPEEDEPATKLRNPTAQPAKKSALITQQLTSDDLADMTAAASRRSARVTADTAPPGVRRKRDAEPVKVVKIPHYDVARPAAPAPAARAPAAAPRGSAPVPAAAPRREAPPGPAIPAVGSVRPPHGEAQRSSAASPAPARAAAPRSVPPPQRAAPAPTNRPASHPPPQRVPALRAEDLLTPPHRSSSGRAVIWISIALAVVIVAVGAMIAWRRQAAVAEERERRLQERFQQLRHQP